MQLHTFGSGPTHRPNPVLCAQSIRVLWASWCDVLIAHRHPDDATESWDLRYIGTGLSQSQQNFLCEASTFSRLGKAIGGEEEGHRVVFFGSAMHHGLRGYVHTLGTEQEIVLFAADDEMEDGHGNGVQEVQVYRMGDYTEESLTVIDIKILNDETLLLSLNQGCAGKEYLACVRDIPQLRVWLCSPIPNSSFGRVKAAASAAALPDVKRAPYDSHDPPQWVSNATTTTLLDTHGRVWTSSADTRYQSCLGRPYDGRSDLGAIPYLSETHITRVVSGGYMSAALSADGELFIWGQACPGSAEGIDIFNGNTRGVISTTGINAEDDQDEFVKCLNVRIDGHEAQVHHVAIGHGHVLVAAESGYGSAKKRAVFAAGDNSMGQLGLEGRPFYSAFHEVEGLRGKQVAQLFAAGWSSFVVTLEE
ncbi:hypothetical protein yc1106_07932 [Curvularia clavata]|uniref:Uncharacterized protein n=1 Tax=Curvularia clavata TaxID=95742 RepID=A0A9Q8ZIC1_CURCL|nr:hypothetical protein yc1106_07932 [Curvularia clavata]